MSTSEAIGLETVVRRSEQILWSSAGDDLVALHMDKGVYYGLDPIGRQIWELLDGEMTVGALCDRLVALYDVEAEMCEADTLAFIEPCVRMGLIEVIDSQLPREAPAENV